MYQVLYRKWRPTVFEDVVGQPQVTVTLRNELKAGRISHAYLFTGSRGTGKTTCAKILSKAVNCLSPQDGDPCGACEICRGIDSGSILDIVEIDAASNNGVDNIRMLREEANFTPANAKYRVYIIDEVHMLSISAFNALLKTLEEPPAHVIFILATTEVHKLPATILSRCQRFDFRRIPPKEIADRLTYIAEQEHVKLELPAAMLIARLADGALRDALSILDQCIGVSDCVTEETVRKTVGLVGRDHLFALADSVFRKDASAAMEVVDHLHNASKDMARLCEELSAHFRALMLMKTVKKPGEILTVTEDELEKLREQAAQTTLAGILHALDVLQETVDRMNRGGNKRVELEMSLIRLCAKELDTSNEALLRRIEALECGIPAAPPISKTKPPQAENPAQNPLPEPVQPAPGAERLPELPVREEQPFPIEPPKKSPARPAPAKVPGDLIASAERLGQWPEILQILKGYSQSIASAFHGSSAYISGDYVLIDAPQSIAFELLRKSSQRDKMRDAIRQVTGRVYKLGPYKRESKEKNEEDPLDELLKKAEAVGVEVIKKQEE